MARLTPEGKLIRDITVRFQVYLERLKAGEIRRLDGTIRQLDQAISAALRGVGPGASRAQLNATLAALRARMEELTDAQLETYMRTLRRFSDYAIEFETSTINLIAPPNSPAITPSSAGAWANTVAQPIQATGDLLEPFVRGWAQSTMKKVEGAIRTGYAQGQTTDEIVRAIRGTKANNFKDGLLGGVTKREANAMVRTSLQAVSNQAHQAVYEENDDLIEGYIWISTLDSRTSAQCQALDGQQFKLNRGPLPPIHVNCRSTTIPKIKGVDLLSEAKRASQDGLVPAATTYYGWLKDQPAAFQNEALGVTRAALFRNGGLSADEFSRLSLDKNFQPLTLEEMRKKNPAAFKRAGINPP